VGPPRNGTVEVAGPEQFRLDVLIGRWLRAHDDPREVVADQTVPYFDALLDERTLLPDDFHATRCTTRFAAWLTRSAPAVARPDRLVAEPAPA
jgi:hypothetical protein